MNTKEPTTAEILALAGIEKPKDQHPMQPIVRDPDGKPRFLKNAIVEFLLDAGPFNMNILAKMPFSREDREQFAQLIGYSVCGFGELSYVSDGAVSKADQLAEELP